MALGRPGNQYLPAGNLLLKKLSIQKIKYYCGSHLQTSIYVRNWSKFDRENFILDYFSVDWEDLLKTDELNADNSTRMYLDKTNMFLDTYGPLKRVKK